MSQAAHHGGDHGGNHGGGHGGEHGHAPAVPGLTHFHSHKKHYIRVGVALTIITAVEIGVLFVPQIKALWVPLMWILAVVKFVVVVGEFMHLREDRSIYKILFISPMFLALFSFFVLGVLAVTHYGPFGKGYALTAVDMQHGFVPATGGAPAEDAWKEGKLQAAFAAATAGKFAKGEKLFATMCTSCHGKQGEGLAGLGPNMTDDCYKHGGKLANLYTTIKTGVTGTAMQPWGNGAMSSEEIREVAFYVRSLRGKNVAGLPCEGDKAAD